MNDQSRQAFLTAVASSHGRNLRRFLAVRMRNAAADVPDLMQEVFLRLLRVESHETIRNPQAYLYTVASHVLYQHTLKEVARSANFEGDEVLQELHAAPDLEPEAQAQAEQCFEALGQALQRKSPKAYATLILHRCEGMPLQEVARRLGISYSMVKRHLAHALSFCQQYLEEIGPDSPR